ncbi:MAG: efflux RND transporter permease subunit [Lachnospiraceae bacterium]|nr:efflux RND transporter permease subunit [Lachnospiraceae bacterium]
MTSKISFSELVRGEMRQMNWLTAVQMVVFVLFLPFRAMMSMAIRQNELMREGKTAYSAVEQFGRHMGLGHAENTGLILVCGAVCALTTFAYLHSQVKQDFYHSLSLKREELFGVKYLSSVLTFVIAYLAGQLLTVLVGLFYQALTGQIASEIALASVQGILFYLCSYSTTLVAMMLAGNFLTTFLAIGAFGAYMPMLMLLRESLESVFLNTKVESIFSRSAQFRFTSPWAWCLYSGSRAGITSRITGAEKLPTAGDLCQIIAITAVLTLAALALYRVRKTEAAGSALAFPVLEPVIKVMVTVPVSLVAGLIAYELTQAVFFEVMFILLFGALACVIIEFIYRMDICQVFAHKWQFAVSIVIGCAIFFAYRFDLPGFNTYLPAQDEIAAMSVSSPDFSSYIAYGDNGEIVYSTSYRERLDQVEWDEFDKIYELAEDGVENVKEYGLSDAIYDQNVNGVYIKYHLKSGKEVYRYYQIDRELYCEVMNELFQEEDFKEPYFPICTWDEETLNRISGIWVYLYGYSVETLLETDKDTVNDARTEEELEAESEFADESEAEELSDTTEDVDEEEWYYVESYSVLDITVPLSRLSELMEAYREDLKEVSFEDIYYSNDNSYIYFYLDSTYQSDDYPVNAKFTNTMALLSEIYLEQQG